MGRDKRSNKKCKQTCFEERSTKQSPKDTNLKIGEQIGKVGQTMLTDNNEANMRMYKEIIR